MKLVELRLKPEKKKKASKTEVVAEHEEYPWGLRINLNDKTISKLGLKPKDMKVGSTVKLEARAFVCSAGEQPGGKHKSIELQLVAMGIDTSESFEDGFNAGADEDDD